eukprot:SAG31_NODE_5230_length_2660_cov_6.073799_2_plen_74_part_00
MQNAHISKGERFPPTTPILDAHSRDLVVWGSIPFTTWSVLRLPGWCSGTLGAVIEFAACFGCLQVWRGGGGGW